MQENTDQNNSEYEHFLCSDKLLIIVEKFSMLHKISENIPFSLSLLIRIFQKISLWQKGQFSLKENFSPNSKWSNFIGWKWRLRQFHWLKLLHLDFRWKSPLRGNWT